MVKTQVKCKRNGKRRKGKKADGKMCKAKRPRGNAFKTHMRKLKLTVENKKCDKVEGKSVLL